jgi:hypothetical protein
MEAIKSNAVYLAIIALFVAGAVVFANKGIIFYAPEKRKLIISIMKDPESTKFRNEFMSGEYLCGEVNSKNSMGGYVGYRRFISDGKEWALDTNEQVSTKDQLLHSNFEILWIAQCHK